MCAFFIEPRENFPSAKMEHLPPLKCSTQEEVYGLSADIGREIERVVDMHGADSARSLVPKLIRVLEFLEQAVRQNEALREEIEHLQQTVKQLEYDKNEKAIYRKKFDQVSHSRVVLMVGVTEIQTVWLKLH